MFLTNLPLESSMHAKNSHALIIGPEPANEYKKYTVIFRAKF